MAQEIGDLKAKLVRKSVVAQRVFATPDGKELLEILQGEFLAKLEGKDPHMVIFNAGRADVVAYLMQLNSFKGG